MTGPEGAPAVPARPDEQAVAEALRWFRENPTLIDEITGGQLIEYVLVAQKHAATIVRAALAGARPAAEPDESMTDAERAIAPFLAWVENFRKNAPELGQALRQRLDEIRATLPTGRAHQPDGGTGDGTTETRTEYRVTATDHAGLPAESEWKRDRDSIDSWAGLWAAEGWTDLVIETRTVTTSTTRTVTPWEAQR